jgi:nucleotide-binding universal stress UspA family protein
MYKHILLPTDGSPLAREAIRAGVKLAKATGARVTGFYAAPPATPIEYKGMLPVGYADPAKREKVIERTAAQYLEAVEKAAKAAGVRCKVEYVTSDYPAEAIVAAAKKNDCDLIFMSSHGRQGLRSMSLLGTQTQKVLSQSKIPVLVHR